ncbi:claret [Anaeramoeba flamelloides]|uniref:Claret n=1 Tax=Anaeramoeba flamelloides TaxID=1746091 RepID=A0ABQ8X8W2_9EUKA|nr:claret [Anaeramoeba flamelloides]
MIPRYFYVFGANTRNCLFVNKDSLLNQPKLIEEEHLQDVKFVAGCSGITCVVTDQNKIYLSTNPNSPLDFDENENVVVLLAGFNYFLILTESNKMFGLLSNSNGQLGQGNSSNFDHPKELNFFKEKKLTIEQIECGVLQSFVLCSNGHMYGMGFNSNGQLGMGNSSSTRVPTFIRKDVKNVWAGLYSYHTFIKTNDDKIFGVGKNGYGQLGLGTTSAVLNFTEVVDFKNKNVQDIKGGYDVSIALVDNRVYLCGNRSYINTSTTTKFQIPPELQDIEINQISCGCYHFLAKSVSNQIYIWGSNSSKQLGNNNNNHTNPTILKIPNIHYNDNLIVTCGAFNSFIHNIEPLGSILTDFFDFFNNEEFTDAEINGIKFHSQFVQFRTNIQIEELKQKLSNFTKNEIKSFFIWLYSDKIENKEILKKICLQCGINNWENKKLKTDLTNLWKDEETKDFIIRVREEDEEDENDDDNENDDDDDDDEFLEEVPIHKFVLLARSGLFREMFRNIQDESNHVTDYSNRSLEAIEVLVRYLYTDEIVLNADNYEFVPEELQDAPEYYQIKQENDFLKKLTKIVKEFEK